MYSSLHKIDIVAKTPEGVALLVQTDHRTPTEVGADQGLSTIFALTRMLVPRSGEYAAATLRYVCVGEVHPLLETAAAACGAELEGEQRPRDLSTVPRQQPGELADAAFALVGRRVLGERGLSLDEDGLVALVAATAPPPAYDDDEVAHYTALVELAAATGEVLRAGYGGRWIHTPEHQGGVLPFMFCPDVGAGTRINIVGRVERFFRHGERESPVFLLQGAADIGREDGPLLFALKPADWDPASELVSEPIASGFDVSGASVPLMVYGHDLPNTFRMLGKTTPDLAPLATLRAEAQRNLAEVEVETERLEFGATTVHMIHGSYFAAAKLLDVALLRRLQRELDAELLAASVPDMSRLLVMSASADVKAVSGLMALTRKIYDDNDGGRQLSPTVFLVSDGALVGVATERTEPPKKKRGFWRRLFGGGGDD